MRVLIVDDHSLFRSGLQSLLEAAGMEVLGQAADGESAVDEIMRLDPDLVLLDLEMPGTSGLQALERIRGMKPDCRIVILTASMERQDLLESIEAGADGYLLKSLEPRDFITKLRGLERGEAALSGEMAKHLIADYARRAQRSGQPNRAPNLELSAREVEVLRMVASGLSNRQIGAALTISENTVKFHVKRLLHKLALKNRAEAAAYAARVGITEENSRQA